MNPIWNIHLDTALGRMHLLHSNGILAANPTSATICRISVRVEPTCAANICCFVDDERQQPTDRGVYRGADLGNRIREVLREPAPTLRGYLRGNHSRSILTSFQRSLRQHFARSTHT